MGFCFRLDGGMVCRGGGGHEFVEFGELMRGFSIFDLFLKHFPMAEGCC